MTVYMCDRPFPLYTEGGEMAFHLWADTRDEAHVALWGVGADPDTCREAWARTWEAYSITPAQFVELQKLGVRVTDSLGPREWVARRDGDQYTVDWIIRRRGLRAG